jgi:hypothetical protein
MGVRGVYDRMQLTAIDRAAIAIGVVCLTAGVAVLIAVSGFASEIVGITLLGIAGIAFVALVFLLVGESEDRDYRKGAL